MLKQDKDSQSILKANKVRAIFKELFYCIEYHSYHENVLFHNLQVGIAFCQLTACNCLIATRVSLQYDKRDYFMRLITFLTALITFSPDKHIRNENMEYFCNFGLVISLGIFTLGVLSYIGSFIYITQNRKPPKIFLGILSKFSVLHPTVIYLPLLLKANEMIKNIIEKHQIEDNDIAALVFLIIGSILNLFLALFHIIRFSKLVNYSTVGAVRTKISQICKLTFKFGSGFYLVFLSSEVGRSLVLDFILTIIALGTLCIYSKYMPRMYFEDNRFPLTALSINLSFCLTLIYYNMVDSEKNASFIFMPCFVIISMINVKIVYHFIMDNQFATTIQGIHSLQSVEQGLNTYSKIGSIFQSINALDVEQVKFNKVQLQAWGIMILLKQFFQRRKKSGINKSVQKESFAQTSNLLNSKISQSSQTLSLQQTRNLAVSLEIELLKKLSKKFQNNPNIALELIARQVKQNQPENLYSVIMLIEKISKVIPDLAIVDIIKDNISDLINNQRGYSAQQFLNLQQVFKVDNYYSSLYYSILQSSNYHQQFWSSLSQKEVSGIHLQRSSQQILKTQSFIENTWVQIQQNGLVQPHGIRFHLLYGIYYYMLRNDSAESQKAMDIVLGLKQSQQAFSNVHPNLFDPSSATCEHVALLMISSNQTQLGQIKYCNSGVISLLGYQPNRLIGRKINTILPKFIAQQHDSFLKEYFNRGKSELINRHRRLFIVNSEGLLQKVLSHVQILPFSNLGIGFLGLLRKQDCGSKDYFLIDYETFHIFGSKSACQLFSLDKEQTNSNTTTIFDICPNFLEELGQTIETNDNKGSINISLANIGKNQDKSILKEQILQFLSKHNSLDMKNLQFVNAKTQQNIILQDAILEFDLFRSSQVLVLELSQKSQSQLTIQEEEDDEEELKVDWRSNEQLKSENHYSSSSSSSSSLTNPEPIFSTPRIDYYDHNRMKSDQFYLKRIAVNQGDNEDIEMTQDENYEQEVEDENKEKYNSEKRNSENYTQQFTQKQQTREDEGLLSSKRELLQQLSTKRRKTLKERSFVKAKSIEFDEKEERRIIPDKKNIVYQKDDMHHHPIFESSQRGSLYEIIEQKKKLRNQLQENYSPITVKMLGSGLFILMISALPINIWVHFYSKSLITNVFKSVDVNKYAEKRYEQYIEVLRRVKLAEIVKKGYIDRYTRHAVMNVPDYVALLRGRIGSETKALLEQNNLLLESIQHLKRHKRKKFFQDTFTFDYQDKLQINNPTLQASLSNIKNIEMNIFEAVQELGYQASTLQYQADYDVNHPNHKFVLRNGYDKLLQSVQESTAMVRSYKSSLIEEYIQITGLTQSIVIILGIICLAICLVINTIQYKSITLKIYEALLKVKQNDVERLQQQCVTFNSLLQAHQNDQISDKKEFWDFSWINSNIKNPKSQTKQQSKNISVKMDIKLRKTLAVKNLFLKTMQEAIMVTVILIIYASLVVIFIFMAQAFKTRVLHMFDRQGSAIDELSYIGVQISAVYQGIADDGQGTYYNKPINTVVKYMNDRVGDIDQFFNNFTVDGINILPNYQNLLLNDICPYAIPAEKAYCEKDAINKKGLFGQKSYYSLTLSEIYNQYLQSNRSEQAKTEAFSHKQLPEIERVYYISTRPAFKELQRQTQEELNQYLNDYPDKIYILTIITIMIYIIIPLIIYKPIVNKIKLSYNLLKDVLKPIPEEIMLENKQLLFHLKKISPKSSQNQL